jgi:hypothetical protein
MRLQTAMIKRERGVIEAATGADMIKLFPTTACPVWQDALYCKLRLLLLSSITTLDQTRIVTALALIPAQSANVVRLAYGLAAEDEV